MVYKFLCISHTQSERCVDKRDKYPSGILWNIKQKLICKNYYSSPLARQNEMEAMDMKVKKKPLPWLHHSFYHHNTFRNIMFSLIILGYKNLPTTNN